MAISTSSRARGGNRGGTGGGYEQTDPEWETTRIRTLRAEYDSLDKFWRAAYLKGLNQADRRAVTDRTPR